MSQMTDDYTSDMDDRGPITAMLDINLARRRAGERPLSIDELLILLGESKSDGGTPSATQAPRRSRRWRRRDHRWKAQR